MMKRVMMSSVMAVGFMGSSVQAQFDIQNIFTPTNAGYFLAASALLNTANTLYRHKGFKRGNGCPVAGLEKFDQLRKNDDHESVRNCNVVRVGNVAAGYSVANDAVTLKDKVLSVAPVVEGFDARNVAVTALAALALKQAVNHAPKLSVPAFSLKK